MSSPAILRWPLGLLLAFGALNAFGGGYYGMAGAEGVPTAWLAGSPFHDYFVPGLVLFGVVGLALGGAALAVLFERENARLAALAAGTILLAWLLVQIAIIGWVSWLQPITAVADVTVLALALALPGGGQRARGAHLEPR
jgi:hypothetical protein